MAFSGEISPPRSYSNSCQEILEGLYSLSIEMILLSSIEGAVPVRKTVSGFLQAYFGSRRATIRLVDHSPLDFVPGV